MFFISEKILEKQTPEKSEIQSISIGYRYLLEISILSFFFYRVLVFSPDPVKSVTITIDGIVMGLAKHVEGPLYVLPWQPSTYSSGLHEISVEAAVSILFSFFFFCIFLTLEFKYIY